MTEPTLTSALVRAVISLAEDRIPPDIQDLLIHGAPGRSIRSGALARACLAFNDEPRDIRDE